MNAETLAHIAESFAVTMVPDRLMNPAERYVGDIIPSAGAVGKGEDDYWARGVWFSSFMREWATPAWAVFTMGHECGHIANGDTYATDRQRTLAKEVRADIWGVEALKALGYDPREGMAMLAEMVNVTGAEPTHPASIECFRRILAMEQYLSHGDVDRTLVSLPVAS